MHSFHHSRGRIFFEVLCAFGMAASCVWAWMQTYATAMLPAAGIAGLYGLVHFFDMFRRRPAAAEAVAVFEPAVSEVEASEPAPVIEAPVYAEPAAAVVAEPAPKRKRKSTRQAPKVAPVEMDPEPQVVEAVEAPEPEVVELQPAMRVVDSVPDESDYVPATPLFEPEPFVRQHRAAFGRKAR